MAAIGIRMRLLEQVIVAAVQQPDFIRHSRGIGAQRVVFALNIHDARAFFFFLADHIAKNAAFAFFVPFARSFQFIFNAARHKNGGGHLRMRVRPLFASFGALIFENADIFKAHIFFQIGDSRGPDGQDALDFFVTGLRKATVMLGQLHDYFVRAGGAHLVVHPFGEPAGLAVDAIERIGMWQDANLRQPFGWRGQNRLPFRSGMVEGTFERRAVVVSLSVPERPSFA